MSVSPGPANGGRWIAGGRRGGGRRETASDYDAMRARIELTRSRLKAKAFDAMMAGESALLGRDPETTRLRLGPPPPSTARSSRRSTARSAKKSVGTPLSQSPSVAAL